MSGVSNLRRTQLACRDKTVIVWQLTREEGAYGFARRALRGHSHFVQVSMSDPDHQKGALLLEGVDGVHCRLPGPMHTRHTAQAQFG